MKILHTEASTGWGGQEMRILKESLAMRERGHTVIFCINEGGILAEKAAAEGFRVYTFRMSHMRAFQTIFRFCRIIKRHHIEVINTHSSIDAWLAGIAGVLCGCRVVRTRHISAPIKPGINSRLLYKALADFTVTTCEEVAALIKKQAGIGSERCKSIPTGIDPEKIETSKEATAAFRKQHGILPEDFVVGTACILRSWKGIEDLLQAAFVLKEVSNLKWVVVGNGPGEELYKKRAQEMGLDGKVIFTGFISSPYVAIDSFDAFILLSTANEGVSQASLQAAYLKKPLITTPTGGLREVCIDQQTGFCIPIRSPQEAAAKIMLLMKHPEIKTRMGEASHSLVVQKFLFKNTVKEMEAVLFGHESP